MLSLAIVFPVLAVAAVVGLVVAAFQAASQIQDPTIAHLPRLLAVVAALVIVGPWMGSQIGAFAERMLHARAAAHDRERNAGLRYELLARGRTGAT